MCARVYVLGPLKEIALEMGKKNRWRQPRVSRSIETASSSTSNLNSKTLAQVAVSRYFFKRTHTRTNTTGHAVRSKLVQVRSRGALTTRGYVVDETLRGFSLKSAV